MNTRSVFPKPPTNQNAIAKALDKGYRTRDIYSDAANLKLVKTREMGDAIYRYIENPDALNLYDKIWESHVVVPETDAPRFSSSIST